MRRHGTYKASKCDNKIKRKENGDAEDQAQQVKRKRERRRRSERDEGETVYEEGVQI